MFQELAFIHDYLNQSSYKNDRNIELFFNQIVHIYTASQSSAYPLTKDLLQVWLKDYKHGLDHSYWVFKQSQQIRDSDELNVKDDDLLVRALLHDLGDFLPYTFRGDARDPTCPPYKTLAGSVGRKTSLQDDRRNMRDNLPSATEHAQKIAEWVLAVGLSLDANYQQLAKDLYYHDHFWEPLSVEQVEILKRTMSPAGKVMADADRLNIRESSQSTQKLINDQLRDNRIFTLGKWYFYRDLSPDERRQWRFRTGGLFDSLSALLAESFSPDYKLYTQEGRRQYLAKQPLYEEQLIRYYSQINQEDKKYLLSLPEDSIQFGLKEKNNNGYFFDPISIAVLPSNFTSLSLIEKLTFLTKTSVPKKIKTVESIMVIQFT